MAFAKIQMEVGRCVGRQDFDGAIRALEGSLSNNSADVPALTMIALCHRWSNRNADAILTAQRALTYDPSNFEAIQLLSEIYAEQEEHETAARLVRLGLENFPEPIPSTPRLLFWLLRVGALIIPRLRRVEESATKDLADPNKDKREWYLWARQYLAWYDSAFGSKQTPTVH